MSSAAIIDDFDGSGARMTPTQRWLTMATVVLGSSLYGTALLTTSGVWVEAAVS